MKQRIPFFWLATSCLMFIAIVTALSSWLMFPVETAQDLRSETVNDTPKEQEKLLSYRWVPFTSEKLRDTLAKHRVAVIWVGHEFSFKPGDFEVILGPPINGVDYYEHLVEWSSPKLSLFYEKYGIPKDGAIIIDAPKRERTIIKFGDGQLHDIRQFIRDSVMLTP